MIKSIERRQAPGHRITRHGKRCRFRADETHLRIEFHRGRDRSGSLSTRVPNTHPCAVFETDPCRSGADRGDQVQGHEAAIGHIHHLVHATNDHRYRLHSRTDRVEFRARAFHFHAVTPIGQIDPVIPVRTGDRIEWTRCEFDEPVTQGRIVRILHTILVVIDEDLPAHLCALTQPIRNFHIHGIHTVELASFIIGHRAEDIRIGDDPIRSRSEVGEVEGGVVGYVLTTKVELLTGRDLSIQCADVHPEVLPGSHATHRYTDASVAPITRTQHTRDLHGRLHECGRELQVGRSRTATTIGPIHRYPAPRGRIHPDRVVAVLGTHITEVAEQGARRGDRMWLGSMVRVIQVDKGIRVVSGAIHEAVEPALIIRVKAGHEDLLIVRGHVAQRVGHSNRIDARWQEFDHRVGGTIAPQVGIWPCSSGDFRSEVAQRLAARCIRGLPNAH